MTRPCSGCAFCSMVGSNGYTRLYPHKEHFIDQEPSLRW